MMKFKIKPEYFLLVLIFVFVFGFRLYFTFQTGGFNTDEAYFHLRHIENLVSENKFLVYDDLSYSGRYVLYPPLFHLLMALVSLGSIWLLKLIPELLISLTVLVVYVIAREITESNYSALFAAMLSGFIPILFMETLNSISVYSLMIPLILLMFYCLLKLENKNYRWAFIVGVFLMPLIHLSSFIFVVTLVFYFFLIAGGAISASRLKKEAAVFSTVVIGLLSLLIYKKALLKYGATVVWQTIPANILSDSFRQLAPYDLLFGVGILPLILGVIGIYIAIIKEKKKISYMFGAFAIATLVLLVLRLLTVYVGLLFLGIALSIFSAVTFSKVYNYFSNTKFKYARMLWVLLLLILFFTLSFSSSISAAQESNTISNSRIKDMNWIATNTGSEVVVLGNIDEGNLISAIAKRKNVIDSDFLLAPNPIERANDVDIVYATVSEAFALETIKRYNVSLVYLSEATRDKYNIRNLSYALTSSCFESYREGKFYVVKC